MNLKQLLNFNVENVESMRNRIINNMKKKFPNETFKELKRIHLDEIYRQYDNIYFSTSISKYIIDNNINLEIKTSSRMKLTAGKVIKKSPIKYDIVISSYIMKNIFNNNEKSLYAGSVCYNRLDCLMRIFEHEFVHFLLFIFNSEDHNKNAHGKDFKKLLKNLFNHESITTHNLLDGDHSEREKKRIFMKNNLKIGDRVQSFSKKEFEGIVFKMNPKYFLASNEEGSIFKGKYEAFEII